MPHHREIRLACAPADGLGARRLVRDLVRNDGARVEVLEVAGALASRAGVKEAIRGRAARLRDLVPGLVAGVRCIERDATGLRVTADAPAGVRLSGILKHLGDDGESVPDAVVFELLGGVARAASTLHRMPGLAHGALTAAHVALDADGAATFTDGAFGGAIEDLQWNRDQLWRAFGLTFPAAAGLPRLDQRADVMQLGVIGLSLALRRPLREDEYPRGLIDLIVLATPDAGIVYGAVSLRMWLQQALQLHPRANFGSAVDAERALAEIPVPPGGRRPAAQALRELIRRVAVYEAHLSGAVA